MKKFNPKRLLKKPLFLIGIMIIFVLIVLSTIPGVIAPHDPYRINPSNRLSPPNSEHLFGTDALGRDLLSRVIYGTRISLVIGIVVVVIVSVVGSLLGAISGYYGGIVDTIIMRIVDSLIAFPVLVLAMVLSAALRAGLISAVIAMIVVLCPRYVRFMRGEVLSVKEELYTEGAFAIGASNFYIILHYIIRNAYDPVLIKATLDVGFTIMYTAALGFIGLGAAPPIPEWGAILSDSRAYLMSAWWYSTFPGLAILISVMGWNFIGDGLREIANPDS